MNMTFPCLHAKYFHPDSQFSPPRCFNAASHIIKYDNLTVVFFPQHLTLNEKEITLRRSCIEMKLGETKPSWSPNSNPLSLVSCTCYAAY